MAFRYIRKFIPLVQTILRTVRRQIEAVDNSKLKTGFVHAIPFWVGALLTGLVAVIYAKLFEWVEHGAQGIYAERPWLIFAIAPTAFLLAWWMVVKWAPYARGSGIPQVSAAIELSNPRDQWRVRKLLSLRIIIVKILSSLTILFGGGAVGREGPTIQISASIYKVINDKLPAWYPRISRRSMLVTGAASGLAAAFNTPLGGIVFAIEELTKIHFNYFKSALLVGVIIAGLTALNFFGPYLYLGDPLLSGLPKWISLWAIVVALVSGLTGSASGRLILRLFQFRKKFRFGHHVLFILGCGLLMALIGYFIDQRVYGSGKEIMVATLFTDDKHVDWYVPVLRFIGPVFSFSTGAAGGIFAPTLSLGACIGSLIAGLMEIPASGTNLLILCGMTGCLTGITRSPFTSSILVIEMTNSHHIIFYLMLSALVAYLISGWYGKPSFYETLKTQYVTDIKSSSDNFKGPIVPKP